MDEKDEKLVSLSLGGDEQALEDLVRRIKDPVYGLSLRMLYHPQDAEDATQEILIKVITNLARFRGESSFRTWVFSIASNHLLTARRRRAERSAKTLAQAEDMVLQTAAMDGGGELNQAEQSLLEEEMRISCLQAMLLCLDRGLRLAFLLGDVFEVSGQEGSQILGISAQAYRKRFSRARARVYDFMLNYCSLIRPSNPCRCLKAAQRKIRAGELDKNCMVFADHPCRVRHDQMTMSRLEEMDELQRIGALFRNYPDLAAPESFIEKVKSLVSSQEFEILSM
ncbi:MAG: RNA polymerase sigma factor [Desulfarculaceae bacterium]|jgi:RNA polymerase sigma factor (sigma-70 family)